MYPGGPWRTAVAVWLGICAVVVAGCSPDPVSVVPADAAVPLPDGRTGFDYQLGGAYTPPPGVTIVERDRLDRPAAAGYNICYVNGFQTQPADSESFAAQRPDLLVHADGAPVADPGWPDEYLFDTSTAAKRSELIAVVGPWIDGCKAAGFSAVEIDNLDSYTRSRGALDAGDNIALAAEYARLAHRAGLAIAQKNTAEHTGQLRAAGYDFAITESCAAFDECAVYTDRYPVVLDIEYPDELGTIAFDTACQAPDRPAVMIMRDHALTTPGNAAYLYRRCPS